MYNANSPAKTISGSLPSGNPENVIDPWSLLLETKDKQIQELKEERILLKERINQLELQVKEERIKSEANAMKLF
jgi:hypothetical protein